MANDFDLLTGSSKQPVTMKLDEVREFAKRLRYVDKDTKKAARQANQRIAQRVVVEIRGAALFDPYHVRQYAKFLPSVKAVQGTTPKIKIGGARNFRGPRYRGDKSVKLWEVQGGVEFGSDRITDRLGRRTGNKFGPRKKGGWVVFPVIKSMQKFIRRQYNLEMEKVLRGL
jgi:hypothetical protein